MRFKRVALCVCGG